jgi:Helix-hairpin-helix motif
MKKINFIKVRYLFCVLFITSGMNCAFAQNIPDDPLDNVPEKEQELEMLAENAEDAETEDDTYLQALEHFRRQPLNLNEADEGLLQQVNIFSPVQINNLLLYRKQFGLFIDIYELQAIPGWNLELIKKLRPYITVNQQAELFSFLQQRLKHGHQSLLLRASQVLEPSKGYLADTATTKNYYPGSPQKILLRYQYRFKNLLQYGFTAEKDAGEQFFKGAQKNGFDFYSAHLFLRNSGIIKSLAIGDFTVNLGQGLVQWQSLAFTKGWELAAIKRQSDILRPYSSAGEIVFNRGAGITLQIKNWQMTAFASFRKTDAKVENDSAGLPTIVSSFHTSGYHRTASEIEGKNALAQTTIGGNITFNNQKIKAGINGVHYDFDHNIVKRNFLYNKYALSGNTAGNYSIDYSYTVKNKHFFGEAAVDNRFHSAFVNGLLISADALVDMAFVYRNISPRYQSLYTSAFTENTSPTNESGLYSSLTIRPARKIRLNLAADFFHFPWIKYRVDAPTSGTDYFLQLHYKHDKSIEWFFQYSINTKPVNYNPESVTFNPVIPKSRQSLRAQLNYKVNKSVLFRSRIHLLWYDRTGGDPQNGFLTYAEIFYKPPLERFSSNIRLCHFESDGYNSRLYAYENDVLYAYAVPFFYNKGFRYYLNASYQLTKECAFWLKIGRTIYPDTDVIGSSLDAINSHHKTELKIQFVYRN